MNWITKDGRTIDEARAAVIAELGLSEEELEIEVLSEGAKGLFGFGGEPAVVRARPVSDAVDVRDAFHDRPPDQRTAPTDLAPPEPGGSPDPTADTGADALERQETTKQVAVEMVEGILERMGLQGEVKSRVQGGTVYVEIEGENMGILIGRGGATLEALQELVRAGVQRKLKARGSVVVDVESYWERRRGARRPAGPRSRSRAEREPSAPPARSD